MTREIRAGGGHVFFSHPARKDRGLNSEYAVVNFYESFNAKIHHDFNLAEIERPMKGISRPITR